MVIDNKNKKKKNLNNEKYKDDAVLEIYKKNELNSERLQFIV